MHKGGLSLRFVWLFSYALFSGAVATAQGLAAATGAAIVAYDSLLVQAARCAAVTGVWAAQPGRRGEVYARAFEIAEEVVPRPLGEIEIVALDRIGDRGPWVAADALDLGDGSRTIPVRSAGEALLVLARWGAPSQPVEPLYVEGPPIHKAKAP